MVDHTASLQVQISPETFENPLIICFYLYTILGEALVKVNE